MGADRKHAYVTINILNKKTDYDGVLTVYPSSLIDLPKETKLNQLNDIENNIIQLQNIVKDLETLDLDELETLSIHLSINKVEVPKETEDLEVISLEYQKRNTDLSNQLETVSVMTGGFQQFSIFSDYGVFPFIASNIISQISYFMVEMSKYMSNIESTPFQIAEESFINGLELYKFLQKYFHYSLFMYYQISNYNGICNFDIDTDILQDNIDYELVTKTLCYLIFKNDFNRIATVTSILTHPTHSEPFKEKCKMVKNETEFTNLINEYKNKISN